MCTCNKLYVHKKKRHQIRIYYAAGSGTKKLVRICFSPYILINSINKSYINIHLAAGA